MRFPKTILPLSKDYYILFSSGLYYTLPIYISNSAIPVINSAGFDVSSLGLI
jgi:hypothetical protein